MNRKVRLYKKLLDYTFIGTFVFLVLFVILLIIGMFVNAYDFSISNIQTGFMREGNTILQIGLIGSVLLTITSIILARVFLAAMQRAETLESAEDLRRQKQRRKQAEAKLNIKEEKASSVAFSQTETYKKIKKEEETEPKEVSISIIDEVLAKEEEVVEELVEAPPVVEVKPVPVKKETYTRVTKGDLIKKVAEETKLSEYKAKKFINALLDEIKDQLAAKKEVKIDDFGRFYTKLHKEREAINPQTFEPLTIEAYTAVKFSAFKSFKDIITMEVNDTANKAFAKEEEKAPEPTPIPVVVEEVPVPVVVEEVPVAVVEEKAPVPEVVKTKPVPKKKAAIGKRTKIDIINLIDDTTNLSKNKANKFLKYFAQVIKETLADKQSIKIDDFGTFTTIVIPEKEGVNPITSEKIIVEAHTQVRLRFDKKFKQKFKE